MKKIYTRTLLILLLISGLINAQWTQLNNSFGKEIRTMIKNGSALIVGTVDGGVYVSNNADQNWSQSNAGLTNLKVYSLAGNGSQILAGTYGNGVFISSDNGNNWSTAGSGINVPYIYALIFSGNNIVAGSGGGGVFTSLNGGSSWSNVLAISNIANALYRTGSSLLLGIGPYIYRSTNDGLNWTSVVTSNTTIKAFAETPNSSGGKNLYAGSLDGVFLSTDDGKNWKTVNTGLTYRNVNALAVSGEVLFAGTENGGVFKTSNAGSSWSEINTGLPSSTSIRSIIIDGGFLYAASSSGTVYKRNLSDVISSIEENSGELPTEFSLSQNYPNPFNPATRISFSIPTTQLVSLKIYDLTGREITYLVNRELSAGSYSFEFNGSNLSSGIYFYKLSTANFSDVKKMMLIK